MLTVYVPLRRYASSSLRQLDCRDSTVECLTHAFFPLKGHRAHLDLVAVLVVRDDHQLSVAAPICNPPTWLRLRNRGGAIPGKQCCLCSF